MRYDFEWYPVKAKQNLRKHAISFQRAATIFRDPYMVSIFDDEHDDTEDRWVTIGMDEHQILLVVSHTFRRSNETTCTIRIISARKAIKRERKQYEEGI
ncbi:MAG: BrnT family toxin [Candidatus Vecturithrix sp.]|jgi:uncharacterized DUF497 family protein|nr:BrnT family toxin [Candidatus Vecturithrix sp.]